MSKGHRAPKLPRGMQDNKECSDHDVETNAWSCRESHGVRAVMEAISGGRFELLNWEAFQTTNPGQVQCAR